MSQSPILYFNPKNLGNTYTDSPTNILAADKFINGEEKYWEKEDATPDLKKRKLLLCDWSMDTWSFEKEQEVRNLLQKLLSMRFDIYVWDKEKPTALTLENFKSQQLPCHPEVMSNAMTQIDIEKDEQGFLSYFNIRQLLAETTDSIATQDAKLLDMEDLHCSEENRKKAYQAVKNDPIQPTGLLRTVISSDADAVLKKAKETFSTLELTTKARVLVINSDTDLQEISSHSLKWLERLVLRGGAQSHIILDHLRENLKEIENLEELDAWDSDISLKLLRKIMASAPKLRVINIGNCENLSAELSQAWLDANPDALKNLERLTAWCANISLNLLMQIAAKAPKLREINITYSQGPFAELSQAWLDANPDAFKNLEELTARHTNISPKLLLQIMASAPKLRVINIDDCENLSAELPNNGSRKNALTLKNLEQLDARGSNISLKLLLQIMASAPKLRSINIGGCQKLPAKLSQHWLDASPHALENLEQLDVQGSNISLKLLQQIMASAPKLRKINIGNCENLPAELLQDWLDANPHALENLEELNVQGPNISLKLLQQIMASAPKLRRINIGNCENLPADLSQGWLDANPLALENLEELDALSSNIPLKLLQQIMASAPKLRRINIDNCKNLSAELWQDWLDANPLALENLEELFVLDAGDSNISPEFVLQIIRRSPSLKKIFLPELPWKERIKTPDFEPYREIFDFYNRSPDSAPCEVNQSALSSLVSQIIHYAHSLKKFILPEPPSSALNNLVALGNDKTTSVDANTALASNELDAEHVFYDIFGNHPPVNDYRKRIFDTLEIKDKLKKNESPFILKNKAPLSLVPCPDVDFVTRDAVLKAWHKAPAAGFKNFYGAVDLKLSDTWQPLPSLTAQDQITHMHADNAQIQYSTRDDLYYVRSKNSDTHSMTKVSFVIKAPTTALKPGRINNKTIQSLVDECSNYGGEALKLPDNPTGQDYLKALTTDKQGACRHRVVAFMAKMEETRPDVKVRAVNNDCHSFAEVCLNDKWQRCELGGHPATLNISENNKPIMLEPQLVEKLDAVLEENNDAPFNPDMLPRAQPDAPTFDSIDDYTNNLLKNHRGKKALIELPSDKATRAYALSLQQYCHHNVQPVYYIDTPDDLRCAAKWLEVDKKNKGTIRSGPGGPLHDFLTKAHAKPPVIIVNWSHFAADDIARFNGIIDAKRIADGTPVPDKAILIGLNQPDSPNAYLGADFYGRFDNKHKAFPFPEPSLLEATKALLAPAKPRKAQKNATIIDCRGTLAWKPLLLGKWQVKENQFTFKPGKLIKALEKGCRSLHLRNAPWHLPDFQLFWQQALIHKKMTHQGKTITLPNNLRLSHDTQFNLKALRGNLNWTKKTTKPHFLNPSTLGQFIQRFETHNGKLTTLPGFIKQHQNKTLCVHLTRDLSEVQWYRLLTLCAKHKVTLNMIAAEGLAVPKALGTPTYCKKMTIKSSKAIKASDIVIDVSELGANDLISSYEVVWDKKHHFKMTKRTCALKHALDKGKSVVLKGKFSPELLDALAPFMTNKKLTLVSETPGSTRDASWDGFYKVPAMVIEDKLDLKKKTSDAFERKRLKQVKDALVNKPYIFISGATGVGKSTFITKVLAKQPDYKIYYDRQATQDWANDKSDKTKILFIDEANCENTDFTQFEGLFNKKPSIIVNGKLIELTNKHKVIFAGNPLNYGGERKLASLFERHGNAIVFEPMPPAYLYHQVLKPLINDTKTVKTFLTIYQHIAKLYPNNIAITARELEMMALMVQAGKEASYSAYTIAKNVVQAEDLPAFYSWFETTFGNIPTPSVNEHQSNGYLITPSRQASHNLLTDLLEVRALKQQKNLHTPGLAGAILIGEPGEGKSDLITSVLSQHKLKEGADFIRLPACLPYSEKRQALIEAFHKGQIVIEDEINSCAMLEKLRNSLLMGVDDKGKKPQKPGFLILGSGNPISFAGRRKIPLALKRRTLQCEINPYPAEEMKSILVHKYPTLGETDISRLVRDYVKTKAYAQENHLNPKPSFRDLLRVAQAKEKENNLITQPVPALRFSDASKQPEPSTIFGQIKAWVASYIPISLQI